MELIEVRAYDKLEVASNIRNLIAGKYTSSITECTYLGGGSYGMAYKVVQTAEPCTLVVKVFKIDDLHRTEANDLLLLGQHTLIKYPEVYFVHDATESMPINCIGMKYFEGKDLFTSYGILLKSKARRYAIGEKIIDSMLVTHSYTSDKFGLIANADCDTWLEYYKPFAHEVYGAAQKLFCKNKLPKKVMAAMDRAWVRFDEIFSEVVNEASLVHGDLNVMNVMVDSKDGQPIAIIDPLLARYADREYDLFQLNNLTGKKYGLYNIYKSKYEVSSKCDIKTAFYGLWNEVYCYITSGALINFIMNPLVKNMNKQLDRR